MHATIEAPAVKERPIIFSAEMVKAILDGRKTQTRRVVKPQPAHRDGKGGNTLEWVKGNDDGTFTDAIGKVFRCPYGMPRDRIWVRETHIVRANGTAAMYRADVVDAVEAAGLSGMYDGWRSPIHMPRWASRITLEITDVGVERVQDISEADARAEGWDAETAGQHPYGWYRDLWDTIHGKGAWERNDWVWALTFKRIEREGKGRK